VSKEQEAMTGITERAIETYRRDQRTRAIIDATVRFVQDEFRDFPLGTEHLVGDIALKAAAIVAQRIYDEDGEIAALRIERDHYRDRVLEALKLAAAPQYIISGGKMQVQPQPQRDVEAEAEGEAP
jgi:hypothetical protein